jgi:predicted tellurium resistance membrane protein TerC
MSIQEIILGLLNICIINIILSGDNTVVIALASRNLAGKQRKLAIFWGSAGAIILCVVLAVMVVFLLSGFMHLTWQSIVMIIIGLILLYLGVAKDYEPLLQIPIGFGCV